jgi:hypothetical protein
MTFQDYINHSWKIHAHETQQVFQSLDSATERLTSNEDIAVLARLITHICGDHLLQHWEKGVSLLTNLKSSPHFKANTDTETAVNRSIAILKQSAGQMVDLTPFSISDQTRILAQTSGILIEHKKIQSGITCFEQALKMSEQLDPANKSEPAFRAFGITANNITCTLEEKIDRNQSETQFMLTAALANLKYWGLAGQASDVNEAQYRLSNSYLQAGLAELGLKWAQTCWSHGQENSLGAFYEFYAVEMLALSQSQLKNPIETQKNKLRLREVFEKLTTEEKEKTEKTLKKIEALT